jgi:general secretion pathway protein G
MYIIMKYYRTHTTQAGFTMIEIMVVLVILGLMAGLVVPKVIGRTDDARIALAKQDMKSIANSLEMYKLDNFNYPSTRQGLQALVEKPQGKPEAANWNADGYLNDIPADPWGNEYLYESPVRGRPFNLTTFGADGKKGGKEFDADISLFEERN